MSSLKGQSRHGELRVAMAEISKMEEESGGNVLVDVNQLTPQVLRVLCIELLECTNRALEFLALEPEQEATYDS